MSSRKPRKITIAEMSPHVHSFNRGENKVNKIADWLSDWIQKSLETGKILPNDFLPPKCDLAFHIGVSLGTIQNAYRILEDRGFVVSKQKIGTYINNKNTSIEKLISKREEICNKIKEYIISENFDIGEKFTPSRKLASIFNISNTTVRLAINNLVLHNILKKVNNYFVVNNKNFDINEIKSTTLVQKIVKEIKSDIHNNYKINEKILSNKELAHKYNVSVKTINDALKILLKDGIIITKRGKYGTIVADDKNKKELYIYEKIKIKIKNHINENCQIGEKLPTVKEFAKNYNVSTKTIKNALNNLSDEGYIRFSRGRYGGTFVIDIPNATEGYKWIAINPNFIEN